MKKIMLMSPKDYNFYNFRSEMILELVSRGYEVILNCPYGMKIDYFTQRGCRFVNMEIDRRGKNPFNDLKLIKYYFSLLRQEKPDVVLLYTGKVSIYAGYVCGKLKIPYIVNNAGLIETKGVFKKMMDFLYVTGWKKTACMMYQNTGERDYVNILLKNRVHYRDIPGSGVNLDQFMFTNYPDNENPVIFNFVGRIVETKGIKEYLECAIAIKRKYPNTLFRVFGDYDDESYKDKIMDLSKKGVIEYCGVQLDMKPFIKAAHAVIHASYYEGMTNVVLEHSSMGRVCIGANIPGIKEGIEDNVSGYLFEPKNVNDLICKVETFLKLSLSEKEKMGKCARKKMEVEFDRNIVTNIYLDEINRIVGENNERIC